MNKKLTFSLSIAPIIILTLAATSSVFIWNVSMHIPLIIGIISAALVAIVGGWSWDEVEQMIVRGVSRALSAVFILLIIGIIVGTWIASGIIPTMIYYGLSLIKPSLFVPLVAIITGIVSITLGSSFTSLATIGISFMAIGKGLGFPPGLIAGAVISGAFFGDKLSPLSDTTNIAPTVSDTDLFSHIKHMLWDTIPAFTLSIIIYWFLGNLNVVNQTTNLKEINLILLTLEDIFVIHPLLFLMPLLTIILMLKKFPAIPTLIVISFLGAVIAVVVQKTTVSTIIQVMAEGFVIDSGVETVDSLLNTGGFLSILETIALLILATALGGILEETGAFKVVTDKFLSRVNSTGSLISTTILFTFIVAFASGEQFISIILPARTFVDKYKEMNIDTKNLSRCVEAVGTVGINLVPWSVTTIFASSVLAVSPSEFIPYTFFAFLVPLINLLFGYTGWTITRKDYKQERNLQEKREVLA